jgi:hypothetical protein
VFNHTTPGAGGHYNRQRTFESVARPLYPQHAINCLLFLSELLRDATRSLPTHQGFVFRSCSASARVAKTCVLYRRSIDRVDNLPTLVANGSQRAGKGPHVLHKRPREHLLSGLRSWNSAPEGVVRHLCKSLKEFSRHSKRFPGGCEPICKTARRITGNAWACAIVVRPGQMGMLLAEPAVAVAAWAALERLELGEAYPFGPRDHR